MPPVEVVFFAEENGSAPVLEWLDGLPPKVRDKFIVRTERLALCGSELRRPEADFLRDGIYELRVRHMHVNFRLLYFFHERRAVLAHGLAKMDKVPAADMERAMNRKNKFIGAPDRHVYRG